MQQTLIYCLDYNYNLFVDGLYIFCFKEIQTPRFTLHKNTKLIEILKKMRKKEKEII